MRNSSIIAAVLLAALPLAAHADCTVSAQRPLELALEGVETVRFEFGADDLELAGTAGARGQLEGRACASHRELLDQLDLVQEREGSTLVVRVERAGNLAEGLAALFTRRYAYIDVSGSIPEELPVQVHLGSGDARLRGIASLDARVGSGDLQVEQVGGPVALRIGSGDATLTGIGPLQVHALGSGDLSARDIKGDVRIGTIGSGDVELAAVTGSVAVERIGSGDLDVRGAQGDLRVGRVGSGEVKHHQVAGTVQLPQR